MLVNKTRNKRRKNAHRFLRTNSVNSLSFLFYEESWFVVQMGSPFGLCLAKLWLAVSRARNWGTRWHYTAFVGSRLCPWRHSWSWPSLPVKGRSAHLVTCWQEAWWLPSQNRACIGILKTQQKILKIVQKFRIWYFKSVFFLCKVSADKLRIWVSKTRLFLFISLSVRKNEKDNELIFIITVDTIREFFGECMNTTDFSLLLSFMHHIIFKR